MITPAITRLMTRLARRRESARDTKASAAARLLALHLEGRPVWTPRDIGALAREGYGRNPVAYRSIRMIAEAAASAPLLLYDGPRELETHDLLSLLARPNPGTSGVELLESFVGHLMVAGNAYLEAAGLEGQVRELHVLRPDRMRIVPGPSGWPAAFEYSAGGETVRFASGEAPGQQPILHLRLFHPLNDHYGQSPLEAAATAIDIHNAGAAWTKGLLDNAARPSGALIYEGVEGAPHLTEDQFHRLKSELEASYQGARNAGRPLLPEGGLTWTSMAHSPADMDFIAAREAAAREIALAFGVPPMLLGIPGDNTYATFREANLAFWRQTVVPLLAKIAAALNGWLCPRYGEDLRLAFDLDGIAAMTSEREALWTRIEGASFLTEDEKRQAVGYGPREGPAAPGSR